MIKEAYCSFEVAKLLKEKGFNEYCYTYYDDIDNSINRFDKGLHFNNTSYPWGVPYDVSKAKKYIIAPTHQMAMAWLREVHNVLIVIDVRSGIKQESIYCWQLEDNRTGDYIGNIVGECSTYEQACEAALKYTFENLI